jgi:hypothetical protein
MNLTDGLITKTMSNKQSSVEWYIIERHDIEIQSRLGKISPIEYDAKLTKAEQQAKAMHREEVIKARQDGLDNGFSNGNWDSQLFYNETFGGNNEQQ